MSASGWWPPVDTVCMSYLFQFVQRGFTHHNCRLPDCFLSLSWIHKPFSPRTGTWTSSRWTGWDSRSSENTLKPGVLMLILPLIKYFVCILGAKTSLRTHTELYQLDSFKWRRKFLNMNRCDWNISATVSVWMFLLQQQNKMHENVSCCKTTHSRLKLWVYFYLKKCN